MTNPRFVLQKDAPLVDEPVSVQLVGLEPGTRVTVSAVSTDWRGVSFSSWAEYKVGTEGVARPGSETAVAGTYRGLDPFGLWWSMVSGRDRWFAPGPAPIPTSLTARVCATEVASVSFIRRWMAEGVAREPVHHGPLVGTVFTPARARGPGVVLVGGSDASLAPIEGLAAVLASRGYVALALAYFGLPGLPRHLVEVPVEYGQQAVRWLIEHPRVEDRRVGIIGISRGGEYALLLGSRCDQVGVVIGLGASPVMWPGQQFGRLCRRSAWSEHGVGLPFLMPKGPMVQPTQEAAIEGMLQALQDDEEREAATVSIERTRGAILFVSGDADPITPSTRLASLAMCRLVDHPFPDAHLNYPGAGHAIASVPGTPCPPVTAVHPLNRRTYNLGGTREHNAHANADIWSRLLSFLDEA